MRISASLRMLIDGNRSPASIFFSRGNNAIPAFAIQR